MRSLTRLLLARATVAASCLAVWAGCSAKQQTEYVTGISTQVSVPRDLKSVLVEVAISGVQQFCRAYRVYDGKVMLPRSLGTFAQNGTGSGPVTYTIIGIGEEYSDSSPNPLFDGTCTNLTIGQNSARILRRSRQPYVPEQILFLPLPLKYSCVDKNCGDEETCKGGKCVSATVADPEKTFPRYTPDLADGTGGTCFHANTFKAPDGTTDIPGCMTGALPAIPVDATSCVYAVPLTPSAPAPAPGQTSPFTAPETTPEGANQGVNVEVTYEGGFTREILDSDPDEGFTVPDPAFPQRFKLAPGLCDMVKGTNGALHAITGIRTSGTCQAKRSAQPLCAADQLIAMGLTPAGETPSPPPASVAAVTKLVPPKSALMLVVDDTKVHQRFFDVIGTPPAAGADIVTNPDELINPTVQAAVKHPAISTVDLGLVYAPGTAQSCNQTTLQDGDIALGALQSTDLVTKLSAHGAATVTGDVRLGAALDRAYAALRSAPAGTYFKKNVLVFSNEFADTAACAPIAAVTEAQKAATDDGISTYVVQIVRDPNPNPDGGPVNNAIINLAAAGAVGDQSKAYGYRVDGALAKFNQLLNDVATCTYDMGADTSKYPDAPGDTLTYSKIADGTTVTIPSSGFTVSAEGRVTITGTACDDYRAAFGAASTFALKYGQPETAAVPVFAQRLAR